MYSVADTASLSPGCYLTGQRSATGKRRAKRTRRSSVPRSAEGRPLSDIKVQARKDEAILTMKKLRHHMYFNFHEAAKQLLASPPRLSPLRGCPSQVCSLGSRARNATEGRCGRVLEGLKFGTRAWRCLARAKAQTQSGVRTWTNDFPRAAHGREGGMRDEGQPKISPK